MAIKFMLAGALMVAGWMWAYMFIRQFLFNIAVAMPLIRKMNAAAEDLIAVGAKRYTIISIVVCVVVSSIIAALIIKFCALYLTICFFVGAVACVAMLIGSMNPQNRAMYDTFCGAYYRFVPDDELRTAMYHKKPSKMKLRLHTMGVSIDCIPNFKDEKKKK